MSAQRNKGADIPAEEWKGPWRRYDILKEGVVAIVVVAILTVLMAGIFSSPDEPQLTFKAWALSAPDNFYATTVQELAGTSESAGYGPPYNTASTGLSVGPLAPRSSGSASRIRSTRARTLSSSRCTHSSSPSP